MGVKYAIVHKDMGTYPKPFVAGLKATRSLRGCMDQNKTEVQKILEVAQFEIDDRANAMNDPEPLATVRVISKLRVALVNDRVSELLSRMK